MSTQLVRTDPVVAGILDGQRTFAGPEHVVIDITNRCNYNCVACWTFSPLLGDKKPPKAWYGQELPVRMLRDLLDDLAAMGTKLVRFTGGGEPFLHPQILPLIAHCASAGLRLDITTNGSKLDRRTAEFLVRHGMGELSVSLWAADEASFAATHPNQRTGDFGPIREKLQYLNGIRRNRVELVLCNVIGAMNFDKTAEMFEFALAVGADRVYFTLVDPIAGATDTLLLNEEQRLEVLRQVDWIEAQMARLPPGRLGLDFFDGFKRRLTSDPDGAGRYDAEAVEAIPCYIGWYFCRVTADGKVCPCCRGVEMPMGDLSQQSFREIWQSACYAEFRHKALTCSKHDPYFAPMACHQMCDNLMHNQQLHERVALLRP